MAEENKIFTVEIITPDRIFYKGEGDMIEFTTAVGEIGVYKKHIPLTTVLAPGQWMRSQWMTLWQVIRSQAVRQISKS
jgi:F0F1-type ATP synthase epsilon subunit